MSDQNHLNDPLNDPLHGVKLEQIVTYLVDCYGWDELSEIINIRCFIINPSVKSSLQFLRKTEWARIKVERLYVSTKARKKS
jgi:uncharacterized protein (DUF2132 family)